MFIVEHFDVCPKKAASVVPRYHNRLETQPVFPHKENRLSFQAMVRRHLLPFWLTDPKCVINKHHRCQPLYMFHSVVKRFRSFPEDRKDMPSAPSSHPGVFLFLLFPVLIREAL